MVVELPFIAALLILVLSRQQATEAATFSSRLLRRASRATLCHLSHRVAKLRALHC